MNGRQNEDLHSRYFGELGQYMFRHAPALGCGARCLRRCAGEEPARRRLKNRIADLLGIQRVNERESEAEVFADTVLEGLHPDVQ